MGPGDGDGLHPPTSGHARLHTASLWICRSRSGGPFLHAPRRSPRLLGARPTATCTPLPPRVLLPTPEGPAPSGFLPRLLAASRRHLQAPSLHPSLHLAPSPLRGSGFSPAASPPPTNDTLLIFRVACLSENTDALRTGLCALSAHTRPAPVTAAGARQTCTRLCESGGYKLSGWVEAQPAGF